MKQTDKTYDTPEYPRQLRLDTTCKCNAKCLSCHRYLSKRSGEMEITFINNILKDVSQWNPHLNEIVPVNYGELFCRQDWYLILNMISSALPRTNLVLPTNGSFLNEERTQQLCKIPTLKLINYSINAFYEDTYEQFTGLKASNLKQIEQSVKMVKVLRPDILMLTSIVFDPQYQTDRERDDFITYWEKLALPQVIPASSAGRTEKTPQVVVKLPCRSIFSDMVIGYDGKLSSCCFDSGFTIDLEYYSGDLKADWNSSKFQELRRFHNEHQRDTISLCSRCTSA